MSDLETLLSRALQHGEDGEWESMAQLLADALEADYPDDPHVLCWLAVAEQELGNEGAAYERFKQALAQEPEDPHLLSMAGTGLAAFDDPEAEGVLRTAALLAPESSRVRLAYGAYLSREGLVEPALVELTAARELDPDDPGVAGELGVALALKGDLDAAIEALDDATRLDPDDGWTRTLLGLALLEQERFTEAAGELTRAAHAVPDDAEVQLLAALVGSLTGRDDLAYEMLERARQVAAGRDRATVEEVQDRLDDGPESARRFLMDEVAPGAFRQRLMARP